MNHYNIIPYRQKKVPLIITKYCSFSFFLHLVPPSQYHECSCSQFIIMQISGSRQSTYFSVTSYTVFHIMLNLIMHCKIFLKYHFSSLDSTESNTQTQMLFSFISFNKKKQLKCIHIGFIHTDSRSNAFISSNKGSPCLRYLVQQLYLVSLFLSPTFCQIHTFSLTEIHNCNIILIVFSAGVQRGLSMHL